ncbi:15609_t:CDS:2, partial [Acaulospora morrowiae]
LDESIKKWERQPEKAYMLEESLLPESESGQVSEMEKLTDLNNETIDVTDEEGGILLSSEKFEKIDWGDVIKEIDDEIGESGDTSAFDESENESGTESNGRKKLKRNNEGQKVVSERYSKRMKQSSPLRQSIITVFERSSELSSESFYQYTDPQEAQEDFQYDNDVQEDGGYDDDDPGNQSDDEEDSDDEKFIHDFEESLKQDRIDDVFNSHEKDDEHFGTVD